MSTRFNRSSSTSPDASNRLVSSRCPECGAPVDFRRVPRDQTQVKCAYCGTLINIPGRSQPQPAPTPQRPPTTIVVSSDGALVKGGWGCGAWMTLIIVVVIVGAGIWSTTMIKSATSVINQGINQVVQESSSDGPGFSLPSFEQALTPAPRLVTAPMILGGDDNAPTQMVAVAYKDNGAILVGFDPVKRQETWRNESLSEKYYELGISADGGHIYLADAATLMALDRTTGNVLWQTSLANNIQTGCEEEHPCLQVAGEQIVALARDGTLQGFTAATGAPLWSRHLNTQPRQFMVNNDQVIVVDNDDSNSAIVLVLNGNNGDLIYQLAPSCTFPFMDMHPHASDQFLVTPDGSSLLVVGSGTYACAWRYSLADGSLVWQYTTPDVTGALPFAWAMSSLAVADPVIYFTNDANSSLQIYALDTQLQDSEPQVLYDIKDYELTMLYPLGDLLLVSAQPSYATDETELWAIDRNTGERRWQRKLGTTHTFDEWVTHPTDQGIFVAVCGWNDDVCRFELLDLATGTSKGEVREQTGGSFSGAAWLGNQGFLTIDSKIYAIDLTTAKINYTWP